MTAFQHAHHFTIDTFNAHNTVVQASSPANDPIAILQAARAVEATHTSKTAAYAPKCKPGTREKIIQDIFDFASAGGAVGANGTQAGSIGSMLWFQGPAGSGKTCIMREVASRLGRAGLLAATYFFSVRLSGLSEEGPFIATIAHQLITTIPHLRPVVLKAVEDNVTIFSESLETQMEQLIVRPLAGEKGADERKYVILVDGFDECVLAERGHLLQVIHTLATSTPSSLLIIIASRPELDIRTTFNDPKFKSITHFVRLQEYDGTSDIRNYLCDEFCRIRDSHPACASIPTEAWPAEQVINTLVDKASGNFVVASTVIKYVDNPRRHPVTILESVMALFTPPLHNSTTTTTTKKLDSTHPLAPLDALYTLILHPPEGDVALIKRILHCHIAVIAETPPDSDVNTKSPAFFDCLLEQLPGTTDIALCDLHSVLFVPGPKRRYYEVAPSITFHHATLREFLTSERRSGDLFQPYSTTHLDVASLCARRLEVWGLDPSSKLGLSSVEYYAGLKWMHHFSLGLGWEGGASDPGPLPTALLEFDARLCWNHQFLSSFQKGDAFDPLSSGLHTTIKRLKSLYSDEFTETCPLGQSLDTMNRCASRVRDFGKRRGSVLTLGVGSMPVGGKLSRETAMMILGSFHSATGLSGHSGDSSPPREPVRPSLRTSGVAWDSWFSAVSSHGRRRD